MVVAIQKRDVTLIRQLMKKQMTVFTIMRSPNEAKFDLSENYLVTGNQLDSKSSDQEIMIGLERLSKLIESTKQPAIVKSLHNDLTPHTIRGTAKPEDVWRSTTTSKGTAASLSNASANSTTLPYSAGNHDPSRFHYFNLDRSTSHKGPDCPCQGRTVSRHCEATPVHGWIGSIANRLGRHRRSIYESSL